MTKGRSHGARVGRWSVAAALVALLTLTGLPVPAALPHAPSMAPVAAASAAPPGCSTASDAPSCAHAAATAVPQAGGDVWFNVSSAQLFSPGPLVGATMAYDAVDNYVVLFGGCSATQCPAPADTWKYAGGFWTNLGATVGPQPPPRSFATMVYDSRDGYVLLFGGRGASGAPLNDTWSFAGGLWQNLTNATTAPPARYAASMAFDRNDNYVLLFGGCGSAVCPRNDTWQFYGGAWKNLTRSAGTPPPARVGGALAYDAGDVAVVLFGGCGLVCPLGDTYEFAKGKWTALTPTGPPPARAFATMTYASQENVTYLFGGNASTGRLSDAWRFTAGRWVSISGGLGPGPAPRFGQAALESTMVWTSSGVKRLGYSIVYGGSNGTCLNCTPGVKTDTWILETALAESGAVLPSVIEVGEPATFTATATGGAPPYVFLWGFGDAISSAVQNPTHAYASSGAFTASVTATDQAGVWASFAVTVTVVPGPAVGLTVVPKVTDVGRPVAFSGSVSGGVAPYATVFSFGDLTSAATLSTLHSYGIPGNYSVQLHAIDAVQGIGDAFGVVTVHPLPSIDALTSTLTPAVGQAVDFTATVSGGTGPFVIDWTFGDGNGSSAGSGNHTYLRAGTFRASVVVTDAVGGSAMDNFTLIVTAAPGSGNPSGLPIPLAYVVVAIVAAVVIVLAVVLLLRRRRRAPPASLAAAPAERPAWDGDEDEAPTRSKRAMRRDLDRFYRRRI